LTTFRAEELHETRRLLEKSLSIDPGYARAYAALSNTYMIAYTQPTDEYYLNPVAVERGYQLAVKAVQLDPNLPLAHAKLGVALVYKPQLEEAIAAFERAIALNPNFTDWRFTIPLVYSGYFARAIEVVEAHMRLDPFYPPYVPYWSGFARYMLKRYSDALPLLRNAASRAPNARAIHCALAATYAQLGQVSEARAEVAEILRIEPTYTIDGTQRRVTVFKHLEDMEHYLDGLRKAGLPER
jgi:adenylate cyclase